MNKGRCTLACVACFFFGALLRVEAQPYDRDFYHLRAQQYMMQGNYSAALEVYNLLIGTDPSDPKAFNGRGMVFERRGDLNNALSDYERALAMNPQYAEALHNREALAQRYKIEKPNIQYPPQGIAPARLVGTGSPDERYETPDRPASGSYTDAFPPAVPQSRVIVRPAVFPKSGASGASNAAAQTARNENWQPVEQSPPSYRNGPQPAADTGFGSGGYQPPSRYPQPATQARVDGNRVRVTRSQAQPQPQLQPQPPPERVSAATFSSVRLSANPVTPATPGMSAAPVTQAAPVRPLAASAGPDTARFGSAGTPNTSVRLSPLMLTPGQAMMSVSSGAAQDHNAAGLALYQAGSYEQAVLEFNEAIRLSPEFTIAFNNRGVAYAQTGKYQNAMDDFNQALRLNPYYYDAQFNREIIRPYLSR